MTPNEYQTAALTKQADQHAIRARVAMYDVSATQLDNAARGIAEEAGECQAVVKRWLEYGRPLDRERGLDEAGDVLWRVGQYLDALGYTMEQAMEANLIKLGIRYAAGFTEAEAADENRDREAEARAVSSPGTTSVVPAAETREAYTDITAVKHGYILPDVVKSRMPNGPGCCAVFTAGGSCSCLSRAREFDRQYREDKNAAYARQYGSKE